MLVNYHSIVGFRGQGLTIVYLFDLRFIRLMLRKTTQEVSMFNIFNYPPIYVPFYFTDYELIMMSQLNS